MRGEIENGPIAKLENLFSRQRSVKPLADALLDVYKDLDDVNIDLRVGADIYSNIFDLFTYRISPLSLALFICNDMSYQPVIQTLLGRGATTSIVDLYLISRPQTYQALDGLVEVLLEEFDNIPVNDILDEDGNTILHKLAARRDVSFEMLIFLLKQGADVNAKNNENETVAHIALENRNYDFFAALLPFQLRLMSAEIEKLKELYESDGVIIEKAYQSLNALSNSEGLPINEASFKDAVNGFLIENTLVAVSDIFASQQSRKSLTMSFFSKNGIAKYMARDVISFNEKSYPEYDPIEEEFYQSASNQKALLGLIVSGAEVRRKAFISVPYRSQPETKYHEDEVINAYTLFYSQGSTFKTNRIYLDMIKESMPDLSLSYIKILFPHDIYAMGEAISNLAKSSCLQKNDRGYAYVISATRRDSHIFATLSIIDTRVKKVMFHIIVNSWNDAGYVEAASKRINNNEKYEEVPVFNGSLHLQVNDDDENCSIYTVRICHALYEVISSNYDLQIQLENLDVGSRAAWAKLCPYFHECLQENLPEFYRVNQQSGNYEVRPYEDLREFNMKMRWEAGNRYIMRKHEKYKDRVAEEHEAWEKISTFSSFK